MLLIIRKLHSNRIRRLPPLAIQFAFGIMRRKFHSRDFIVKIKQLLPRTTSSKSCKTRSFAWAGKFVIFYDRFKFKMKHIPLTLNLQFLGRRKQMNNLKVLLREFWRRSVSRRKSQLKYALLLEFIMKNANKSSSWEVSDEEAVSKINFKLCFNCNRTLFLSATPSQFWFHRK